MSPLQVLHHRQQPSGRAPARLHQINVAFCTICWTENTTRRVSVATRRRRRRRVTMVTPGCVLALIFCCVLDGCFVSAIDRYFFLRYQIFIISAMIDKAVTSHQHNHKQADSVVIQSKGTFLSAKRVYLPPAALVATFTVRPFTSYFIFYP